MLRWLVTRSRRLPGRRCCDELRVRDEHNRRKYPVQVQFRKGAMSQRQVRTVLPESFLNIFISDLVRSFNDRNCRAGHWRAIKRLNLRASKV